MAHSIKHYICASIVCGVLLAGPATVEAKSDREKTGLIGPVKTVVEESGPAEGDGRGVLFFSTTFNVDGMEIGKESGIIIHSNSAHDTVKKSTATYDPNKKAREFLSYSYTKEDGTDYEDGFFTGKDIDTFDAHGNMIKHDVYEADGSIQSSHEYRYDNKGNITEDISYRADGSKSSTESTIHTYDEKGHLVKSVTHDGKGSSVKVIYRYDTTGRMTEQSLYDTDGSLAQYYRYDEARRETERSFYSSDNSLAEKRTMKYDEFDSLGNWIKKIETLWAYENGSLSRRDSFLVKRTITYY
ncbi:MAG: hypothetical protein HY208_01490 [Nitrospirae bacterium]|nr:hypothetical protein [Nitrospirota bacterium]